MEPLAIRLSTSDDLPALTRLAALDSAEVPFRPMLVAEAGDGIVAALSLRGGAAIADPFRPTAPIVQLLRLRAEQLRAGSVEDGPRPVTRMRLVMRRLATIP
jgi:hypothetical protein